MGDEQDWAALAAGDPAALTTLYDRYARAVYNFAFRRTASWSVAEDVTQATFVSAWRRARSGSLPPLPTGRALPWLLGVADHESRNTMRGAWRRCRLRSRLAAQPDVPADPADEVAARLDDERRMAELRRAVADLPAHERVAIELVTWSGLSVAEAAVALGVAEGTVKSRMSRARRRLGDALIAEEAR